jgi:hypothetical protein
MTIIRWFNSFKHDLRNGLIYALSHKLIMNYSMRAQLPDDRQRRATTFYTVVPTYFESTVRQLLYVTLPVLRILKKLLHL